MSIQPKIFKTSCTSWWMSTLLIPSCKSISVVVVFRQDAAVGDTKQNYPPCLIASPSPSDRKLSSAREMASLSAPAWLDLPPPLTLHSKLKRPSTPMNCNGNISCSLRGILGKKKRRRENDQEIIRWKNETWLNGQTRSVHYLTDSGINGGGLANLMSGWVTFQTSVEDPGAVKCLLLQSHHHI